MLKEMLRKALNIARYCLLVPTVRGYHRLKNPAKYRDPFEVIWVNPLSINKHTHQRKFRRYAHIMRLGIEKPGNWDLEQYELTEEQLFVMMEKRLIKKMNWEEIDEYQRIKADINQGKKRLKCSNINELNLRIQKLENMARAIEKHGYKTQRHLKSVQIWDEIRVALSRNNELLFIDGRNRLAIARALRLKKIPVIIAIKHPKAKMNEINT